MKKCVLGLFCLISLMVAGAVLADTTQEINHLLDYVATTDCKYDRNGTVYDGPEARNHMNRKYQYYRKKVRTAEDFIKYSATRSTVSGKDYKIRCPGADTISSSEWLLDELRRYRQNQPG